MDCSNPVKLLLSVSFDYTIEMAYQNNDILNTPDAKSINTGRLNLFIENVNNKISDCVFITTFGLDGPPTTSILKFDGNTISYTFDNSRYSKIPGDISSHKIKKIYTEKNKDGDNLIFTSYHAVTFDNVDYTIFNDFVFINVKRRY
ncbi:DUF4362 domain-containing protein [Lachnoclostridium phytofermentans]|uniref:DUF4362 domain-containing protein n=1 Tax=Lachnoclostridium phytofermentans (strain ATCC 700394 / DSM 18823 / ISDg) TaxID=357809 RepID=A9KM21_LACP7|nr:DUF4362 domain-containing protein [Lachnoclostridium phytofermentans]ABX41364.1 hypothetical protein Cphy_0984 [Lachnoclostridium phytofermentans ISDg]